MGIRRYYDLYVTASSSEAQRAERLGRLVARVNRSIANAGYFDDDPPATKDEVYGAVNAILARLSPEDAAALQIRARLVTEPVDEDIPQADEA